MSLQELGLDIDNVNRMPSLEILLLIQNPGANSSFDYDYGPCLSDPNVMPCSVSPQIMNLLRRRFFFLLNHVIGKNIFLFFPSVGAYFFIC